MWFAFHCQKMDGWKWHSIFFFFSIVRNLIYEVIISIKSTECIEWTLFEMNGIQSWITDWSASNNDQLLNWNERQAGRQNIEQKYENGQKQKKKKWKRERENEEMVC